MGNNYWRRSTGCRPAGQSTVEILIALAIIVFSLASAVAVIYGGQSLVLDSEESSQALRLAQENLENAKASSTYNFNSLISSSSTLNEFLEELIVSSTSATTKQITSRVSWRTDPLRLQKVELVTLVTNWYDIQATGGDTGGSGLVGNWLNPQTLGSINLGPGESATGLDVFNKIVYMSAVASSLAKPDFFIIDATNPSSPTILSSLDTGPGLNAVDMAGTYAYAYVAQNSVNNQLQVIDVSNLSAPRVVSSTTLPFVSGAGAVGNSIFFYNSKVYIGTKQATGPEFHIFDVSNPQSPVELGNFKVNADVNAIQVSGSTAYLATSDPGAQVKVLNVSNPASITSLGSYAGPGSYPGLSLYLVGTKLYLGRANGASDGLDILSISNPASIFSLGSIPIGSDVNGIRVRDYLAFLATAQTNAELQIFDISNPASIIQTSSFNFPNVADGIDYESNLVYAAVRSNDSLRIITSQ